MLVSFKQADSGNQVFVNADQVISMEEKGGVTLLTMSQGPAIRVQGLVAQVAQQLNAVNADQS